VLKGGALQRRLLYLLFSQNTQWRVLLNKIVLLFLHWFFIGYWILKTGLDVYPGPFFFCPNEVIGWLRKHARK